MKWKEKKTVHIVTQNQKKLRVSVILAMTADSKKLQPYIIFKGKITSPLLTKEILNLPHIKNREIYFAFNKNAWTTGEIMWLVK